TAIDAALEKLNQVWQSASQEMYKAQEQAGANADPNANANQENPNSDNQNATDDVEYEEVDQNK
ncbi:MAG: hypothetical protein WAU21_07735, partial [Chitinophagales bacterium]